MLGLRHYRSTAVDLFQGDITSFVCDLMVNAANEGLVGGGGVDGAIHRVGGPSIAAACLALGHCATGSAVLTEAGLLPAKKIAHAVGPVWRGGGHGEAAALRSVYLSCLTLAVEHQLRHVALPSISTGAFAYPLEAAASIALSSVREFLDAHPSVLRRITFVLFDRPHYQTYQKALFKIFPETDED